MKKINLAKRSFSFILISLFLIYGCDIEPEDVRIYKFTLTLDNQNLSNTELMIQTEGKTYFDVSDENGECEIVIPNEVTLPEYLIVTFDHNNIKPRATAVSGLLDSKVDRAINCVRAPSKVFIRDARLHHLGNDEYGGLANSQHQLPTEGLEKTFNFHLSSIPSEMPYYQMYARGIEHPCELFVNGVRTNIMNNSSENGNLGVYNHQLNESPNSVLRVGNNTFTIKTGANNQSDLWDDIEFCGLLIYQP